MKTCPLCKQTYPDDDQNFCLNDGNTLIKVKDDPPPTVLMNEARVTNQNWSDYQTNAGWGNRQMTQNQPFGVQNQQYSPAAQNQTLAVVSLSLGILGLLVFCCYGGIPFGIGALVTGYLALGNANREPLVYGGRNLAIGGMVMGAIALVITLFWIIFVIAAS